MCWQILLERIMKKVLTNPVRMKHVPGDNYMNLLANKGMLANCVKCVKNFFFLQFWKNEIWKKNVDKCNSNGIRIKVTIWTQIRCIYIHTISMITSDIMEVWGAIVVQIEGLSTLSLTIFLIHK